MIVNLLIFIIGSIVGSFLNVCIHRLPKKESVVTPRSHCPHCKKNIAWYDNIPLLSYALLRGKCRFCKGKISFRYFLVELITAALFLALFLSFGFSIKFFAYSMLAAGLIIATFVDFEIQEIPDEVTLWGIVLGLIISFVFLRWRGLVDSGLGVLIGGVGIYLMGFLGELVFKKEAMGGGDVKLLAMIGAFLGWKLALFTFFAAPLFGAIVGVILKIKDGRETIPYGPYLSLAAVVAMFFGDKILGFLAHGIF